MDTQPQPIRVCPKNRRSLSLFSHFDNMCLTASKSRSNLSLDYRKLREKFDLGDIQPLKQGGEIQFVHTWLYFDAQNRVSFKIYGDYVVISLAKQLLWTDHDNETYQTKLWKALDWLRQRGILLIDESEIETVLKTASYRFEHAIDCPVTPRLFFKNHIGKVYTRKHLFRGHPLTRFEVVWKASYEGSQGVLSSRNMAEAGQNTLPDLVRRHTRNLFDKMDEQERRRVFGISVTDSWYGRKRLRQHLMNWIERYTITTRYQGQALRSLARLEQHNRF